MNDFVNKYKMAQGGAKPRQINKDQKKAVTKALHSSLKMAIQGQVASIIHNGVQYMIMRQDVLQGIIDTGGKMLVTEEQKEFHKHYQVLMHLMQNLNLEDPDESEAHDEIDQFSFDMTRIMNDPKKAKQRRELSKEFNETVDGIPLLVTMRENLEKQMNPQQKEKVVNHGKLT